MLAYLDTPSGISGDMFLGCLVDAGWPIEALREAVRALNWPDAFDHDAWSVEQREVMKGPLRATLVEVKASESGQSHRHLSDIRALLEGSRLPEAVIADALAVFTDLAEAEGAVHGMDAGAVHFHEVGALD
ncbi:MAG: nickel insertion protein, partial [Ardenticatenaceae bacterium]